MLNMTVSCVDEEGIHFSDGGSVPASTIIWTAGVKPAVPKFINQAPMFSAGRIHTNQTMAVTGLEGVFALGDNACPESPSQAPAPMLAQVAVAEAMTVAHNIIATIDKKPLALYTSHLKGSLVSLGEWYAAGEIFSCKIYGTMMWWLWRTVYLFKFISWKKRFRIAFEWTVDLFSARDISKLS